MIGKGKSRTNAVQAFTYNEKGQSLLKHGLIGNTAEEKAKEFKTFQLLNDRCKKNVLHFQISPVASDQVTKKQFQHIAKQFIQKMNLNNHQYEVFLHNDTATPHIHIVANRIDEYGNAWADCHSILRSARIADEIALQMNLTRAKEKRNKKLKELKLDLKKIKSKVRKMSNHAMQKRPKTFNDWAEAMSKQGAEIKPHYSLYQGKEILNGYRLKYGNYSFKASDIHKSLTVSRMSISKEKTRNPEIHQVLFERELKIEQQRSKSYGR